MTISDENIGRFIADADDLEVDNDELDAPDELSDDD